MKLSFEETTRGNGKIYIHVNAEDVPESCLMVTSSLTADGSELPTKLISDTGLCGYVLVLPVVDVDQVAKVTVVSPSGKTLNTISKTIHPFLAKINSRINTAIKNPLIRYIRNCDDRVRPQMVGVWIDIIIPDVDGTSLVHGTASASSFSRDDLDCSITIKILGPNGHDVGIGNWICMGDSIAESHDFPGVYTRNVNYSIRIPCEINSLMVCVSLDSQAIADGFDNFLPDVVFDMRQGWERRVQPAPACPTYEKWYLEHHRVSSQDCTFQRARAFENEPMFSLIVPLYKTPLDYFRDMTDSVLNQTYGKLELLLVNASPEDEELSQEVETYLSKDHRIKQIVLEKNLGITENTNAGILAAKGDYLCFLDHDDIIEPDLLFEYVKGINKYPTTDLLYCDEDKLRDGHYCEPFFKPDWNPDLLLGENYVCHLLTVRKSIVDGLDLPTSEYDGAQDHHMTFRVSEKSRNVFHARRVLYHWRVHKGSTAASIDTKPYALDAGVRAVQSHLDRMGFRGEASRNEMAPNTYKVKYQLENHPLVSIIIPTKDMVPVLSRCLDSICDKSTYDNYEIILVENNSTEDETYSYYKTIQKKYPRVRVEYYVGDGKFNYSKVINFGASKSKGDYLLLLNNDVQVISPNWMETLLGSCSRKGVGAAGARLLYPDGTIQHAGVVFESIMGPVHISQMLPKRSLDQYGSISLAQDYSALTGACLLTKRDTFYSVGGIDETLEVDFSDIDYCLKLRQKKLLVVYEPSAELYHYESVSRGHYETGEKALQFCQERGTMMSRWAQYYVNGDPYSNVNFSSPQYHHLGV